MFSVAGLCRATVDVEGDEYTSYIIKEPFPVQTFFVVIARNGSYYMLSFVSPKDYFYIIRN